MYNLEELYNSTLAKGGNAKGKRVKTGLGSNPITVIKGLFMGANKENDHVLRVATRYSDNGGKWGFMHNIGKAAYDFILEYADEHGFMIEDGGSRFVDSAGNYVELPISILIDQTVKGKVMDKGNLPIVVTSFQIAPSDFEYEEGEVDSLVFQQEGVPFCVGDDTIHLFFTDERVIFSDQLDNHLVGNIESCITQLQANFPNDNYNRDENMFLEPAQIAQYLSDVHGVTLEDEQNEAMIETRQKGLLSSADSNATKINSLDIIEMKSYNVGKITPALLKPYLSNQDKIELEGCNTAQKKKVDKVLKDLAKAAK